MREAEYAALRDELLACIARVRSLFRWGASAIPAIFAVLLIPILGSDTGACKTPLILGLLRDQPELLNAVPTLLAGVFACVTARLIISEENAADQLGGFLAVFHDHPERLLRSPPEGVLGFHAWSRIQKAQAGGTARIYFIQSDLWLYVLELLTFSSMLPLLSVYLTGTLTLSVWAFPVVATVATALYLRFVIPRAKAAFPRWTEVWSKLAHASTDSIRTAALTARLVPAEPAAHEPQRGPIDR